MRTNYVEFLGGWGSGKTTLYNALQAKQSKLVTEDNHIIWGREQGFSKYNKFNRKLLPIISIPLSDLSRLFNIVFFAKPSSYVKSAGKIFFLRKKLILFKKILIDMMILRRNPSSTIVQDEPVLHEFLGYFDVSEKDIMQMYSMYCKLTTIFIIYIDTPESESFERLQNRKKVTLAENILKKTNNTFDLEVHRAIRTKFSNMYNLLETNGFNIIKVDGTVSVEKNTDFLSEIIENLSR